MSTTPKENIRGGLLPGSFFEHPTTPGPPKLERAARRDIQTRDGQKSLYARMGQV